MIREILASAALVWYVAVVAVCTVGYVQLFRYYSKPPPPARCLTELSPKDLPHVTIIRPVKGLEPSLYQCLAATFLQTYPRRKLTLYFCVESRKDPAVPVIERLLKEFSDFDAKLLVEEEDPELNNGNIVLGPNPKIRNMSRAYREAKGDLIWIIDCNVWVGKGVAGRMVDTLSGFRGKKNKFVHQLPLVVDTAAQTPEQIGLLSDEGGSTANSVVTTNAGSTGIQDAAGSKTGLGAILSRGGGRLEEMFMSSAHAKFYTAINTVLIAPCIVGKSTMFRKSHLDYLTSKRSTNPKRSPGIDFFSDNICEDHLIGDLLWKNKVPQEEAGQSWGKHAMVFGDLAVQPMAGMSVKEYIARRVRWLRVRKFTVTLATLVEHGTESIACSLYGAYAITTLPWFSEKVGIPPTWLSFALFFFYSMTMWCLIDWTQYIRLHSAASIEVDNKTPDFALLTSGARLQTGTITPRSFSEWVLAWCGREILAFPIWFWAVFGGVSVTWRGKRFWVGLDMKVHEIEEKNSAHHEGDATKRKRRAS